MSRMRTPSSALPASPHGLALGLGIGAAARAMRPTTGATRLTAVFLGLDFTTFFFTAGFFAAAFGFFDFLRGAIFHPPLYLGVVSRASRHSGEGQRTTLFFSDHALRVEVADAAALGAGRRVDHRVDEGRLAGIHGLVHGAPQLVRRRRIDADAAECLRNLVVARVLDED